VAEASRVLSDGWPVAIPTDTVYGLAVDPFRPGATDRLFEAKRRPRGVTLPVLVAGLDQALSLAGPVSQGALALMRRFWPGPLTVVVARRDGLGVDLGDDDATIGVRCPAHPVARALSAAAGPLATTSANLHGEAPLVAADDVASAFGATVPLVLDGGPCTGLPSTVVDCTGGEAKLLRQGGTAWDEVLAVFSGR
jgi:tRNA threonylcarbamoyl adenosine modification protein (Sua5/YciO/YrdC/YwlC family)